MVAKRLSKEQPQQFTFVDANSDDLRDTLQKQYAKLAARGQALDPEALPSDFRSLRDQPPEPVATPSAVEGGREP